jgi:hypothetical protein
MFDGTIVSGTWISDERISCVTPKHSVAQVIAELSITDDLGFFENQFVFNYYATCPKSACGSQLQPQRGYCSMGNCNCFIPWIGSDCSILGLAPQIVSVSQQSLLEAMPFDLTINISQGTLPVSWSLNNYPDGMNLNSLTGRLQWSSAVASSSPYTISVTCSNLYGSDTKTFQISVRPSYSAILNQIPKGPYTYPPTLFISGSIVWNYNDSYMTSNVFPVALIIKSIIGSRTIIINAAKTTNIFFTRFYPLQYEVGLTEIVR